MSIDLPGFADPVAEAQAAFRAVLDALARPGTIHPAGAGLAPPAPLQPATAAMLLTLVDAETPLFLDPAFAAAADWVRFHCGAPLCAEPADASFLVCASMPALAALATGTDEEPQGGATVFLQLPALTGGAALRIAGPGLPAPATITAPLPADFAARWADNHAQFPRGVDLVLCAGARLLALPRSLRIEEG